MIEHLSVEELKNWRKKQLASLNERGGESTMKLQELFNGDVFLLTEKSKLPKYALGKLSYNFAKADEQNSNFRIYPENLMIREIDKKSAELKKEKIAGMLDHPLSGNTQLDSAMHILNSVTYDKKTKLASAESFILNTSGGRNFMTLLDSGIKMGASMRSYGTVGKDKKINPDWNFQSIDFVQNPAFGAHANIDKSNLIESADPLEEKKEAPDEALIQFVLEGAFDQRQQIGHEESWEKFLLENEAVIRATVLTKYGLFDSVEEALLDAGQEKILRKMKGEEKVKHYTNADCYIEARLMGISPDLMAERLNKAERLKQINEESGVGAEAARRIVDEAIRAGMDMSDPEKRKKHLEFAESQRYSEPTIHERALSIQKRRLAEGKKAEDLELIKEVIIFDDGQKEIEKKRMSIKAQVEREISQSGAFMSTEETRKHVNRQLRKSGLPVLNEDGE